MQQITINDQVELGSTQNIASQQEEQVFPFEFEIDADHDAELGMFYRLWQDWNLLGIFYHNSSDGKWLAQSCFSHRISCCDSAEQAQILIIAMSQLLIA